jgi:hypothetical protein
VSVNEEAETIRSIVDASRFPLAIVQVGVGDGPWVRLLSLSLCPPVCLSLYMSVCRGSVSLILSLGGGLLTIIRTRTCSDGGRYIRQEMSREFDDKIEGRLFDNWQVIKVTEEETSLQAS